jgi:hypothetical protein
MGRRKTRQVKGHKRKGRVKVKPYCRRPPVAGWKRRDEANRNMPF